MSMKKVFCLSVLSASVMALTACDPAVDNNGADQKAASETPSTSIEQSAQISSSPYTVVATNISGKIPDNSRVAINLRGDDNQIPQHLLVKIISEFSDALIQESNGRFVIINRSSTEQLWEEVVEFNHVGMDVLTQSASADVSVTVTPTVKPTGVDLSISAYSLNPNSLGQTLAAANTHVEMDLKAEVGLNINTIDDKLDNIVDIITRPAEVQKNELARLIEGFAKGEGSPIDILRTFSTGCDRPAPFEEHPSAVHFRSGYQYLLSGTQIRCELYIEGEQVLVDNIDFEDKTDIFVYMNGPRSNPATAMVVKTTFPNHLYIPNNIDGKVELIACDNMLGVSDGLRLYQITVDNKAPIFAEHTWSAGSAGSNSTLQFFYTQDELAKMRFIDFDLIKPGEEGMLGRICER